MRLEAQVTASSQIRLDHKVIAAFGTPAEASLCLQFENDRKMTFESASKA